MKPQNVSGLGFGVSSGIRQLRNRKRKTGNPKPRTFNGSARGQIWSTDFAISLTIFSIALLLFFGLFQQITARFDNWYAYQVIQYHAHVFSNQLLLTPGTPANWEKEGINSSTRLGLVNERNILVPSKLDAFFDENAYETIREKNNFPYQFAINITSLTRNETLFEIGNETASNDTAPVQRMALLNDTPVWVIIRVWK